MEHSEASQHLVDYIKGTLTDAQQQAIAAHVAMHPECAETVAFLRRLEADLARHGDGLLAGHPAADTLVAHAVGDVEAMEPLEREAVARHVAECATCFTDIQLVRRVHAELVVDDTDVKPRPRAWRQWLPVAPALAAGLVLGIVAPWGRDGEPAAPPLEGAAPVVRLVGNLRDGVAPEFSVPARARALPMTLAWDPWSLPGAVPASALVFRISAVEDGRVLWTWRTTIAEAWDPAGSAVSFLTPADRLGVGERVLTIEGPDGSEVFSARLILRPR